MILYAIFFSIWFTSLHVKSWLIGKDPDAGRDWGKEEKGTTEDEMAGWHHWLDAHEFGWAPGVGDGQGGLACCDSWGCKESDMTEQLNWTELTSLSMIISRFISVATNGIIPLFIMAEQYSVVCVCIQTTSSLFIHVLMDI